MTYFPVQPRYYVYIDSLGEPLNNGFIYIGDANLDPKLYPAKVSWDVAGLYPVSFPVRTRNGYPLRDGDPAQLFLNLEDNHEYSILIEDEDEVEVFSSPTGLAGYFPSDTAGDATTLQGHPASYFAVDSLAAHLAGNEEFTGVKTFSSNSNFPVTIDSTNNAKLLLAGSNNPYIRFRELAIDKAYIQWSDIGYLYFVNLESDDILRLGGAGGFEYSPNAGSNYYTTYTTANDSNLAKLDAVNDFTSDSNYPITISGTADNKILMSGSTNPTIRFQEATTNKAYIQWWASQVALALVNQAEGALLRIKDDLDFSNDNGLTFYSVWHAGNDGSGSGLDADTVDGYHVGTSGATIPLLNGANTFSGVNTFSQRIDGGALTTTSKQMVYGSGTTQWLGNSDLDYLVLQGTNIVVWDGGAYRTIWHSNNDGSGSGLDADLLDGYHVGTSGATIPLLNGANTFSGQVAISNDAAVPLSITGTNANKILLSGATNPRINFSETSTAKAYIQWNPDGHLYVVNEETNDVLRLGGTGFQYSPDLGVSYYDVFHEGINPSLGAGNGISGSIDTTAAQTITVTNGIITAIA